ncbi:thiaminase II [Pontivivens insulae]|uniref:Aminopyrimidine aminohydrolase n=1 Tax=Pontivivens insulae TaxID=1639689 RepID=A0A2R8A720_9RHOB|nr:thiaminase II [Pontivivens insulae]RED18099.1 thiaminase/transcriptional activator TenA [Pontivivens insulae]SPF27996.1 Aminopyrimidine aminohydrolase [Pontivivens insulae]
MTYGATFTAWRDATPAWRDYTAHSFVQGLGDGSLPRAAFLHYLQQDYVFLIHFSRAWALAVTKAETVAEMRLAAATVNALINEELALHIETCAEAGIDEAALFATQERQANLAYTRYVLDAGHSGDLLDLLAALAPCVMGYGEIGKTLAATAASAAYRPWIETYASAEYQSVCRDVGQLLDDAVAHRLGANPQTSPRWSRLQSRFATATMLEVDFWDMGLSP